jgi:hypothetical protein
MKTITEEDIPAALEALLKAFQRDVSEEVATSGA